MRRRAMHCNSRGRPWVWAVFSTVLVGVTACKRSAPPPVPPVEAPAPSAQSKAPPRCTESHPGKSFTVGERSSGAPDSGPDDDDDGADQPALPFAVELGRALSFGDGFAVSALSTQAGATRAFVALVGQDGGSGKLAELGKLHADPDPPELAAYERDLVALVHDTDAGGELLRLAAIRPGSGAPDVVLGAEIAESRDESRAADVELGAERGVAIWDEWSGSVRHGVIYTSSFARTDVSNVTKKRVVSSADEDAEAPRLVRRPGGFWAAWLSRPLPTTLFQSSDIDIVAPVYGSWTRPASAAA